MSTCNRLKALTSAGLPTAKATEVLQELDRLDSEAHAARTAGHMAAAKARGAQFGPRETPGRRAAIAERWYRGETIASIANAMDLPYNSVLRMVAKIKAEED